MNVPSQSRRIGVFSDADAMGEALTTRRSSSALPSALVHRRQERIDEDHATPFSP